MNFYDLNPEQQQSKSLQRLFRYLREDISRYHPFLRHYYREQGIDVAALRSEDDLSSLPIVTQAQLRTDPTLFVVRPHSPDGPPVPPGYETESLAPGALAKYVLRAALNMPRDRSLDVRHPSFREKVKRRAELDWLPVHFHASTGSTGDPTPVVVTLRDIHERIAEMAALTIQHKRPEPGYFPYDWSQRWMSLMPGAPHIAFYAGLLAKVLVGLPGFDTFGGAIIPTDRQVELFVKGGFTTIIAIPSYLTHWLRRARALQKENKVGPLKHLRMFLLGAEPISRDLREYIRGLAVEAGADTNLRIIQSYGMTEFKWIFYECAEDTGLHLNPKFYYWELVDPETRKPVKPGEPGVLVFSHIGWRGTALIRYWTGDLIKGGMRWDRCEHCGYTFPRIFPPICRAEKDFTKIKGTRVDLSLLVETVRATPGVRRFQISLENENQHEEFSRDLVIVNLLAEPGSVRADLELAVRQRMKNLTEIAPDLVAFEDDEAAFEKRLFSRTGVKADYIVERRRAAANARSA